MATKTPMTIQNAHQLLRKIINAKDGDELHKIVSENVMWCDGVFFAELDKMVDEFTDRGDETSARKMKEVGDFMARLRFMI